MIKCMMDHECLILNAAQDNLIVVKTYSLICNAPPGLYIILLVLLSLT